MVKKYQESKLQIGMVKHPHIIVIYLGQLLHGINEQLLEIIYGDDQFYGIQMRIDSDHVQHDIMYQI